MTAALTITVVVLAAVALAEAWLLLVEDAARRAWKRSFRRERQWNREHFTGSGASPYDLERSYDTRKAHP